MKLFCSYAYTGEDLKKVTARTQRVIDALNKAGHEVYCPLFDGQVIASQESDDMKAVMSRAFEGMRRQDALIAIITSERRSEGQLMEIGAALSHGMPVYLLQHASAKGSSYLPKLAKETVVWEDEDDLDRAAYAVVV